MDDMALVLTIREEASKIERVAEPQRHILLFALIETHYDKITRFHHSKIIAIDLLKTVASYFGIGINRESTDADTEFRKLYIDISEEIISSQEQQFAAVSKNLLRLGIDPKEFDLESSSLRSPDLIMNLGTLISLETDRATVIRILAIFVIFGACRAFGILVGQVNAEGLCGNPEGLIFAITEEVRVAESAAEIQHTLARFKTLTNIDIGQTEDQALQKLRELTREIIIKKWLTKQKAVEVPKGETRIAMLPLEKESALQMQLTIRGTGVDDEREQRAVVARRRISFRKTDLVVIEPLGEIDFLRSKKRLTDQVKLAKADFDFLNARIRAVSTALSDIDFVVRDPKDSRLGFIDLIGETSIRPEPLRYMPTLDFGHHELAIRRRCDSLVRIFRNPEINRLPDHKLVIEEIMKEVLEQNLLAPLEALKRQSGDLDSLETKRRLQAIVEACDAISMYVVGVWILQKRRERSTVSDDLVDAAAEALMSADDRK